MAGEVTYQPTEADYVGAHRDWFINLLSRKAFATLASMALVMACTLSVFGFVMRDSLAAISMKFGGGLLLGTFLLLSCWGISYAMMPRRAGRLFRQHRSLQREVSYGWSDAGLSYRGATSSGLIVWDDMHRRAEGRHAFLFYLTDNLFHFVPRRALSDSEAEDLRDTVRAIEGR